MSQGKVKCILVSSIVDVCYEDGDRTRWETIVEAIYHTHGDHPLASQSSSTRLLTTDDRAYYLNVEVEEIPVGEAA